MKNGLRCNPKTVYFTDVAAKTPEAPIGHQLLSAQAIRGVLPTKNGYLLINAYIAIQADCNILQHYFMLILRKDLPDGGKGKEGNDGSEIGKIVADPGCGSG
jgi:hypothetical protein